MPSRTPRFNIAGSQAATPPPKVQVIQGYDGAWRAIRLAQLNREPLCRRCAARQHITAATQVDHIKPKALGGTDALDILQSICAPCHRDKTREDIKRIRRGW